jgi:hypothetical protein
MLVKILIDIIIGGCVLLVLAAIIARGSRKRYGNVE